MTGEESSTRTSRFKAAVREFTNSGLGRLYLAGTIISGVAIAIATGNVGVAINIAGWVGLFFAVTVNELTAGYTMGDTWIDGDTDV